MDNLTLLALAKALEKLAAKTDARAGIAPGAYKVDTRVVVHLKGSVNVGEDSDYIPTTSIPIKIAFALFLKYSGVTRGAAMTALVQAMTEAIVLDAEGADTVGIIEELADLEAAEGLVRAGLAKLPKKPKSGAVTHKLAVQVSPHEPPPTLELFKPELHASVVS